MKKQTNYNETNYFVDSYGTFAKCERPKTKPDFISKTGSEYWYIGEYLYRYSNHWSGFFIGHSNKYFNGCSRVSSCKWFIRLNKEGGIYQENYPYTYYKCWCCGRIKFNKLKKSVLRS